jgi:hypothetical protein
MAFFGKLVKFADRLTNSASTRIGINQTILKRYGTMTHLKIDPATKSIDLDVELLGETSPIHVHIDRYIYEPLPTSDARITLEGITVSRAWMQELAKNFAENQPILIPPELARYLGMVL